MSLIFLHDPVKKASSVCCNLPSRSPPGAPSFAVIVSAVVTSRICFLPCSDEREELGERAED